MGSKKDAHIHSIPISSSVAAGAIGGAIWGGVCLTAVVVLYILCGAGSYYSLYCLGAVFAIASFIAAPAIGVVVMSGTFHGNILEPTMAVGASVVSTLAVFFFAVFLFMSGAFLCESNGEISSDIASGVSESPEVQPPDLGCKAT